MIETIWQYTLIFLMAATPWFEILLVIPIGIGMGLDPLLVGIFSFIGNFLPVLFIIYLLRFYQQTSFHRRRKAAKLWKKRHSKKKPGRNEKAQAVFQKYGLPGLAIAGPAITGIHLAAVIALSLKADKHATAWWMGSSLFLWSIFLTIASIYSIDWIQSLFN
ncbi:small multi-drug export protein [Alkalicoccus daliensis]|uniref:Putative small multi-drug export protein n=1 Tax=Alkalicoccus daliensis TaxID=745820 RepID=A0A1H0DWZ6_9BACI|nr:small multi-drug export protein [Alkalicoccus daliensis]SDN74635.1 Putative small multi-drug export protein [Alkalicoccus daliensis]